MKKNNIIKMVVVCLLILPLLMFSGCFGLFDGGSESASYTIKIHNGDEVREESADGYGLDIDYDNYYKAGYFLDGFYTQAEGGERMSYGPHFVQYYKDTDPMELYARYIPIESIAWGCPTQSSFYTSYTEHLYPNFPNRIVQLMRTNRSAIMNFDISFSAVEKNDNGHHQLSVIIVGYDGSEDIKLDSRVVETSTLSRSYSMRLSTTCGDVLDNSEASFDLLFNCRNNMTNKGVTISNIKIMVSFG